MKKKALFLLLMTQLVQAGNLTTCPNLEESLVSKGWFVTGVLQKTSFKKVLISVTRVLGRNTLTCQYDKGLNLAKSGNFQPASGSELWQIVHISGLSFRQCLASIEKCRFYSEE